MVQLLLRALLGRRALVHRQHGARVPFADGVVSELRTAVRVKVRVRVDVCVRVRGTGDGAVQSGAR